MTPRTAAIHAGMAPEAQTGAVIPPIFQTSTFAQSAPGQHQGFDYSRADNPTRKALEEALAAVELGAKGALAFASGLAAEQAVLQLIDPPAKILVSDDVYGGTGRLFRRLYQRYGFQFEFLDLADLKAVTSAWTQDVKMVWVETPTNPLMKIVDVQALSRLARSRGARIVVDNTFATPVFQSPFKLGAHIVLHSSTKYLGGHSDLIGGAVMVEDPDLLEQLKFIQFASGPVPSPFECFLLLRSLKTLHLRMQAHHLGAMEVSGFLEACPQVECVLYPGLLSHPQHALAREQMSGFSGMISLRLKGDYEDVCRFLKKLKLFVLAESLGGVESLVNHPEKMTHASVPESLRQTLGIDSQLIRLSVGIEDPQDLVEDLRQALH